MNIICSILFIITVDGINIQVRDDVEGRLINKGTTKYLVNFSQGVRKFPLVIDPDVYKSVLVDKNQCVQGEGQP